VVAIVHAEFLGKVLEQKIHAPCDITIHTFHLGVSVKNVVLNALGARLIVAIITLYHLASGLGVRGAANSTVVGHCLKVGFKNLVLKSLRNKVYLFLLEEE
tara:strand:- start:78 stop:380 length:303 start_codon:yes stop_codon:yes gene_type:complete